MTPETLDRLEAAACKQSGLEFGTGIFLMPGQLLQLVELARISIDHGKNPAFLIDLKTNDVMPAACWTDPAR